MKRRLLGVLVIACALAAAPALADDKTIPSDPGNAADPFQNTPPLWRMGDLPPASGHGREAPKRLKEPREKTRDEKAASTKTKAKELESPFDEQRKQSGRFGVDYDRAGRGTRTMNGVPGVSPAPAQPGTPVPNIK